MLNNVKLNGGLTIDFSDKSLRKINKISFYSRILFKFLLKFNQKGSEFPLKF